MHDAAFPLDPLRALRKPKLAGTLPLTFFVVANCYTKIGVERADTVKYSRAGRRGRWCCSIVERHLSRRRTPRLLSMIPFGVVLCQFH
ncbi:hypothetical protein Zmor_012808 [Zophobas morio]|uniref:Uncharacterized protein n=1 Tax=Zophobas morio TaxID=2755281 RepID=A0AA38IBV9_9CUCU|nr:hypothetical protein Zmor_012808 [Zophobas morio]